MRPDKCWWLVVEPVFVVWVCDESFRKCKRTGKEKVTGTDPGTVKGSLKCSGIGKRVSMGIGKCVGMDKRWARACARA